MAEVGCAKDGSYQNLSVMGTYVGGRRNVIALSNIATVARTLLTEESGSLITLDPNINTATTITITLPSSNQLGCEYDFYVLREIQDDDGRITISTGDNDINIVGEFLFREAAPSGDADFSEALLIASSASKLTIGPTGGTGLKSIIDATIRLRAVSTTQWHINAVFPNVVDPAITNLHTAAGAAVVVFWGAAA